MTDVLLFERDAWIKALLDEPDAEIVPALRKGFGDCVKAINVDERSVDSIITTGAVDRDGDIINPKKWQLKDYKKNPVVQWAHDHSIPVIASSTVKVEGEKLISKDTFPEAEVHPFADMIFNLVAGRFIRAKSVGFLPERGKFEWVEDDSGRRGYNFNGQELLEHSFVNVPSNPEALVGAKAAGIDIAPMVEWAKSVLDADEPGLLWLPRETVERALKVAENERTVIPMSGFKLIAGSEDDDKPPVVIFNVPLERRDVSVAVLDEKLMDMPEELYDLINSKLQDAPPEDVPPIEFEVNGDKVSKQHINNCPHCHEDHEDVIVIEYGEPVADKIAAWGPCPATGAMLVKFIDEETGDVGIWKALTHSKGDEPATQDDEVTGGQLLVALLDSSEPKGEDQTFTRDQLQFIGQALGQAVVEHAQESVRQRLTALTGRLD